MHSAGMTCGMIGIDSASDTMLKAYHKPFDMAAINRFLAMRGGLDFSFLWTFIIGGPGESKSTVEETMRFIENIPPSDVAYVTFGVRVYADTPIYTSLVGQGAIAHSFSKAEPVYYLAPDGESQKAIELFRQWAEKKPNVLLSTETFGDEYGQALNKATAFGADSPGWKSIPVVKKLMKRLMSRRVTA